MHGNSSKAKNRLESFANLIVFSVAIYAVLSKNSDDSSAADIGLALSYSMSVTQILNFLIRSTAELEVNVRLLPMNVNMRLLSSLAGCSRTYRRIL